MKAPVAYWTEVYDQHWWRALWRGGILSVYAVGGIIGLWYAYDWAFAHALDMSKAPGDDKHYIFILMSAALATAVTIAFWLARFFSRLYLSERHITLDAKLRATMARCYLAMITEKGVEPADRALVLGPLFRPGTDGIIQDDAGLDGAVAMLARALEKN